MNLLHTFCRRLAPLVLGLFGFVTLYTPALQAGMLSAPAAAGQALAAADARDQVDSFLQRADVRERLTALGVDPADAATRVEQLTDAEVTTLAQRLDNLPAGGDSVIGAIVLIFLVLLFTDIMGFTNVFPFVKKTAR